MTNPIAAARTALNYIAWGHDLPPLDQRRKDVEAAAAHMRTKPTHPTDQIVARAALGEIEAALLTVEGDDAASAESIARIIDPDRWHNYDQPKAYPDWDDREWMVQGSVEKARVILALLSGTKRADGG